jgi:nucleoside-diphosphate-sugar epimerase
VYDCTSPAYDAWATDLFPVARGALYAAASAGAKLIVLDNLYMYGRPDGPIRETSPIAPCSRKGELRARLADERADAHKRGDVRIATARAGDFFGPGVVRQTTFGERFYLRAFAGKRVECFGDPDMPHALSYAPDVARALVTLADHDDALGGVWHVPTNPAESMRQTVERLAGALARLGPHSRFARACGTHDRVGPHSRFARACGTQVPIRIARVPRIALRAMGLFAPLVREVAEMAYQWDVPYVLDDSRFRARFGSAPTPIEVIIDATARWASATFGAVEPARAAARA